MALLFVLEEINITEKIAEMNEVLQKKVSSLITCELQSVVLYL